jgi:hypothetical protein
MSFNLKAPALILATVLVGGAVTVVNAQTGVPAGGGAAGGTASGLTNPNPGTATGENNSGGTAPGPVYPGPAAQSGANSPPVNSGITDPKRCQQRHPATDQLQSIQGYGTDRRQTRLASPRSVQHEHRVSAGSASSSAFLVPPLFM